MTIFVLPDWQRAFGEPVASCHIRKANADFQVSEQLGFELSGDGEHDYLQIEKDGANTAWVARGLAKHAGIAASDVGFAGLKDRHAVTKQWFSVRRPAGNKADWMKLDLTGVRVLQEGRHRRKLRRGAHAGNRFRVALRNLTETRGGLRERLAEIRDAGVPNYFGEQRFGRDGGNLGLAGDLFAGRRLSRGKRGMALSAARSGASTDRTDQLMWKCEGSAGKNEAENMLGMIYCAGYLDGMIDMATLMQATVPGAAPFCPPKTGISLVQARLIFIKWAKDNPDQLHNSGRVSAVLALRAAFPCP